MKPVVDRLKAGYAGRVDIRRMDTDVGDAEADSLARGFGIEYVPTFVFVDRDGTVSGSIVGQVPEKSLVDEIARLK